MNFLSSGLFWGVVLILMGISLIFKHVFHIDLYLFRVFGALFVIYLGINILTGGTFLPGHSNNSEGDRSGDVVFGRINFGKAKNRAEYNTVFGRGELVIDENTRGPIELNTVFGWSVLRVDPSVRVDIELVSVFSGVFLPDGSIVSFGKTHHRAGPGQKTPVEIQCNTVFGKLEIAQYNGSE